MLELGEGVCRTTLGGRQGSPADEAASDEEDAGVGRHHGVHAAGGREGQQLVDDERAGEGHQHRELRRHDPPRAGHTPRQHIPCKAPAHMSVEGRPTPVYKSVAARWHSVNCVKFQRGYYATIDFSMVI